MGGGAAAAASGCAVYGSSSRSHSHSYHCSSNHCPWFVLPRAALATPRPRTPARPLTLAPRSQKPPPLPTCASYGASTNTNSTRLLSALRALPSRLRKIWRRWGGGAWAHGRVHRGSGVCVCMARCRCRVRARCRCRGGCGVKGGERGQWHTSASAGAAAGRMVWLAHVPHPAHSAHAAARAGTACAHPPDPAAPHLRILHVAVQAQQLQLPGGGHCKKSWVEGMLNVRRGVWQLARRTRKRHGPEPPGRQVACHFNWSPLAASALLP